MKFYTVLHTKQNENYQLYQYQRADFSYQQRRQKSSNSKAACPSFCSNRPKGFRNSYSRKVSSSMQRIPKTSCSHKVSPIYISSSVLEQQYTLKACIIFWRPVSTASLNLNMRRVEKLQPCIKMNLYHWWHLHTWKWSLPKEARTQRPDSPRSKPLAQSGTGNLSTPLKVASCSLVVCPQTFWTALQLHMLLLKERGILVEVESSSSFSNKAQSLFLCSLTNTLIPRMKQFC